MIIKPFVGATTLKGYANKSNLSNARYVLCQHQGGSTSANPSGTTRYIHIVGAGDTDGTTDHRIIAISGQTDHLIIAKSTDDLVYATNGNSIGVTAGSNSAGILFTKIYNPHRLADDKNDS